MSQNTDKIPRKRRADPPSLHPVPFEDAVRDMLQVKPEKKSSDKKRGPRKKS